MPFPSGFAALYDGNDALVATRTPADYKFLHDGTGMTVGMVVRPEASTGLTTIVRTADLVSQAGLLIVYNATLNQFEGYVANASGTRVIDLKGPNFGTVGQGAMVVMRFGTAFGGQMRVNGGTTVAPTVGTPSTANPAFTFTIGATTAGFKGYIPEIVAYNRILSDTEVAVLESYLGRWDLSTPGVAPEAPLTDVKENCVSVLPAVPGDAPLAAGAVSAVPGYRIKFGDGTSQTVAGVTSPTCTQGDACGYNVNAGLVQRVTLPAGDFLVSWYGKGTANVNDAVNVLKCNPPAGTDDATCLVPSQAPQIGTTGSKPAANGWTRYWREVRIDATQSVEVAITHPGIGRGKPSHTGNYQPEVSVGALMLEPTVAPVGTNPINNPKPFANTDQELSVPIQLCEDTSGTVFRATSWRGPTCVQLCADGFSTRCDDYHAKSYCYRETEFSLNESDIEAGRILNSSGFARGNFNYRIDSIGVNFVGSSLRNCTDSNTPSTCYSAGFIPYSISHTGPFTVRNDAGRDYIADLFNGNIEHARGLATERYLTNPLSTSDTDLIQQYMRTEFRGRPLDGTFVLRVWDEDSADFNAIQDAQIVLKYRYWTRFE